VASLSSRCAAPERPGTEFYPNISTVSCELVAAVAAVVVEATENGSPESMLLPEDTAKTDSELDVT
jgi:hypothetical protein